MLSFLDRLPGPAAFWYLGIGLLLGLLAHLWIWFIGESPVLTLNRNVIAPVLMFAWFAWLIHTLNKVATSTFDEFRPALGDSDAEDGYLHQLTTIRDRDAVAAGLLAVVVVAGFYYLGVRPPRIASGIPIEVEVVSAPLWGIAVFVLGIAVMHTIRQLRLVSRLGAVAKNVDIFKPAPLNAFAKLTAVSALGLIAFVVGFVLFSPEQPLAYIVEETAVLVLAAASFVLPLRVLHSRLQVEKARLLGESQDRLKRVLDEVHSTVDGNDYGRSEQLNNALNAVLSERRVLDGLHTWPWSTSTIRGFTTALILPIALIVLSQILDRLI